MFCSQCGNPVPDGASGCPKCGAPVASGFSPSTPSAGPATAQVRPRSNTVLTVVVVCLVVAFCGVLFIGIMAAIAIPNFVAMQYRAKRAEVPTNVNGIRTAEIAYNLAFGTYIAADAAPGDTPGKTLRVWTYPADFQAIGWVPSGQVRGTYSVEVSADGTDFVVVGVCDVDGDGEYARYKATRDRPAEMVTPQSMY
jgi:type II secretory pathway pseudopilin PulG